MYDKKTGLGKILFNKKIYVGLVDQKNKFHGIVDIDKAHKLLNEYFELTNKRLSVYVPKKLTYDGLLRNAKFGSLNKILFVPDGLFPVRNIRYDK